MIFSANKLFPLNACFQYSSIFHSIAASNSHLSLDQSHTDLWLEASGLGNLDTQISKQCLTLIVRLDPTNYPENYTCSTLHDKLESTRTSNHRAYITPICDGFPIHKRSTSHRAVTALFSLPCVCS